MRPIFAPRDYLRKHKRIHRTPQQSPSGFDQPTAEVASGRPLQRSDRTEPVPKGQSRQLYRRTPPKACGSG